MAVSEVDDVAPPPVHNDYEEYVADAKTAVAISFVNSVDSMVTGRKFEPEFVYQHFGDNETIFGYKNLKVILHYSDVSMYIYPEIMYSTKIPAIKDLKADDIIHKLKEQLPNEQLNTICSTLDSFKVQLNKQGKFQPFGELISKFSHKDRQMELWKVTESSPSFNAYLARVQTIALWYIEASNYTDNDDSRWFHYFLYESVKSSDGYRYKLAGYASLIKFFHYPDKVRARIAHILVLPEYQKVGYGSKFLQSMYRDLATDSSIYDVTVEDPDESFTLTRDHVDCCNCSKLNEFQPDNVRNGFKEAMADEARKKFKINARQARRVYEILRLYNISAKDEQAMKDYRIELKRRLEIPYKKNAKCWSKLSAVLGPCELAAVFTNYMDDNQRIVKLQRLYEDEVASYKKVIARLSMCPKIM